MSLIVLSLSILGVLVAQGEAVVTPAGSPALGVRHWNEGPEPAGPGLILAQAAGDDSPAEKRTTLFDQIKIDLLDLDALEEMVDRVLTGPTIRLSLEECVHLALQSNQDLLVIAYEPLKTEADLLAAQGEFDPLLSGRFNFTHSRISASAQTVTFGGITQIESYLTDTSIGLSGRTQWGTQYSLDFAMTREEGTFTLLMEEFSGGITVTLTQPLLRGRGPDANLARVRSARNAHYAAEFQVQLTVLTTMGEVVKAYWDLVGAIENLKVREESLANAERLVDINERRLEIGTGAAIEVLQAKAGVATRQGDLISARTTIADAEDILKQLLNMKQGDLFSSERVIPTNRPGKPDFEWESEPSLRRAIANRPEIRSAEYDVNTAELEVKRARNDLLPQLDFTTSYRQAGRSLELRDAFRGVRDHQDQVYSWGLTASVPLGNRTARGSHQRAVLSVRQALQRLEQAKQEVMLAVRIAARAAITSQILVESNRQARILQEANVAAEERRLRLGVTTSHRVLQILEDLTGAQTQEVQATINFEKALTDVQVAEGTLLVGLGIEYEAPQSPHGQTFMGSMNIFRRSSE